ncbi:MAG: FtsW/RodA/SpoVE family cell cycle protein [Defluviitaleaceae bacterium]|nr:FtsW/RodA/SpoVE family cell cycle protein [Defluviitaleaceae bacterium]
MFDILVLISRYFFVAYILIFLLQGALYIRAERSPPSTPDESTRKRRLTIEERMSGAVSSQRGLLVAMHVHAYLIIANIPGSFSFDAQILTMGATALGFHLAAMVAVDLVYKNSCRLLWNCMQFLLAVGLIMLQRLGTTFPALPQLQLTWFVAGFAAVLVIPLALRVIPHSEKLELAYLGASGVLLFIPLVWGTEVYGARRVWEPVEGVSFQPSELVKFLFVFYLASALRTRKGIRGLVAPGAAAAAMVLLLVLAVDLGGALIFFMTFMIMLYISTGNVLLVGSGLAAVSAASVAAYQLFAHLRRRVVAWLDPFAHIDNEGFQIVHALFAIGTFGLLGSGLTRGAPERIPVVVSDFIFAAIAEEFGAIFAIGLIGIYILVFYRGCHIALRCAKPYYALLAAGFTGLLAFQTFMILGGVTRLIPLTGVTLPFVSYGGSSIVVSVMMIGILQWVYLYNRAN